MVDLENEDSVEVVSKCLDKAFLGHSFLFGFKSHISTSRLKKSTFSPITLAQVLHGGKLLQSRSRYQDRNNLVAVLMLSPYSESFPTVVYNIRMSNNCLKPLNVSPRENGSPAKEDEIVPSQMFFQSSMTNANASAGSRTGNFSEDSFGQSTLQFSCEEPLSESDITSDVPKYAPGILETKSAECISNFAPKSTHVLKQDDKDCHSIQRTRSDLCQYIKNSSFPSNKTSSSGSVDLSGDLTNVSKSLLPRCPSPKTKNFTASCLRSGREKLRNLEIKTHYDSSDLSGSSEGELSERRKEKRSCSLPKLTGAINSKTISSDDYTPKAENYFTSCNDIVDDPDILEQLFDDNESWLQAKDSKADSKIQEHSDIPESENINDVLDNVFKNDISFEHDHSIAGDRNKHDTSRQKKDNCHKDKFEEITRLDLPDSDDLPESEDIDAFLKKSSSHIKSKERVFPSLAKASQSLQSSQVYKADSSDKNTLSLPCHHAISSEICSRKVIHQKPPQRKMSRSNAESETTSIVDHDVEKQSVSVDGKGKSIQDIDSLKNTEGKLFDKVHNSICEDENIGDFCNTKYDSGDLGEDCNIVTSKSHVPVRQKKRVKRKTLCKTYQEKFIEKYSDKLTNNPLKANPVPVSLKSSGLPVKSRSVDKSQSRQSLVNMISDIERRTQILDLLKADCEMKRVEILIDLKCQSLQNNTEGMLEKSDNVMSVCHTQPFLYSSTKELQSSGENVLDDKPKSLSAHQTKNKKKQTSDAKAESPYGITSFSTANRTRNKTVNNIRSHRFKRLISSEPCSSASVQNDVYFNSQKMTLHKRTNRKYDQYVPESLSNTASFEVNTMATTDHNTIETSSIDNISGLKTNEAYALLQENRSLDHVCTVDSHSPKDLREDYDSNCNTNRSNNEDSDNENCSAKIDMLLQDRISIPKINSEPLYSDCYASFSSHYNDSLDLFETPEPGKGICNNLASSSTKCLTNCPVDFSHVSSTDELHTPETDKNSCNNTTSNKSGCCMSNETVHTPTAGDLIVGDGGERRECYTTPVSSKSRRVQFSERLSHVSSISVIDMMMQTSSPTSQVQKTSSLKSCLKKSVTETSDNCAITFSQDLFSPSPIAYNSLKRHKADDTKYDQLKAVLSYDKSNPEGGYAEYANRNNNNYILESSFEIDSYFYEYENADSPLLFSEKKLILSAQTNKKKFRTMCEDKAALTRAASQHDSSQFLLTPDLFSP